MQKSRTFQKNILSGLYIALIQRFAMLMSEYHQSIENGVIMANENKQLSLETLALSQVLSVICSDQVGLNVDDPFIGQETLSHVVSNVTFYEVAS